MEAWKAEGCCPRHRGGAASEECTLPRAVTEPARLVAEVAVRYVGRVVAAASGLVPVPSASVLGAHGRARRGSSVALDGG